MVLFLSLLKSGSGSPPGDMSMLILLEEMICWLMMNPHCGLAIEEVVDTSVVCFRWKLD